MSECRIHDPETLRQLLENFKNLGPRPLHEFDSFLEPRERERVKRMATLAWMLKYGLLRTSSETAKSEKR
jgi:hypothetical protein